MTQVVQWCLARIAKYDGIYRSVCSVDAKGALATAAREDADAARGGANQRGPMWGVPIVIKANTSIKGLITSDGWKGFIVPGHELIAPADAPVVAKLRAAGAVILGQTNMPDFAAADTTRSSAFGRTGNAYDVRFSPGGSSGGTVTAVTANFALLGTGTDTSNSIRMPSSTSAVVGVLPTRGLVSIAGIAPLDWLLDDTGPIARNVTDAAIALGVMAGEDPLDFRTKGSAAKAQASSVHAIFEVRRASRKTLRRAFVHPQRQDFGRRRIAAPRDSRDLPEGDRRNARCGRNGADRRRHSAGEFFRRHPQDQDIALQS
ncbi:MAG: amidase [Ignavibacteriota bacterium]